MTYEELVQKVKDAAAKADASNIKDHVAFQFNVIGDAAGAFYLEIKDGKVNVEPYEYYETDEWIWTNLYSGYEYVYVAAGMNADSVWGDMAMATFKTTGQPAAVENVGMSTISVYPNPTSEYIVVNGVETGEIISVIDLRGNVIIEQKATSSDARISLAGVVPGVYMVRTAIAVNKFIVR